jgi:hypothetical protein
MEHAMTAIPENPDALLTRNQTAAALTEAGFPVSQATLSTKATRGGGPPFQKFGPRAMYRWGTSLQWAEGRLSDLIHSTSETSVEAARQKPAGSSAQGDHR